MELTLRVIGASTVLVMFGAFVGFVIACLLTAASQADDAAERDIERMEAKNGGKASNTSNSK